TLNAAATAIPNPDYQWWFNGAPLANATNSILAFSPAQGIHSGFYWLVASNVAGMVTSRVAAVLVIVPPAIVQQPVSQAVFSGQDASFNVTAIGAGLTYQWTFNGMPLSD